MLIENQIQFRVRYAETDAMGFVHHSHYLTYFEMGRTELLRAQGGNYSEIEKQGFYFVVTQFHCKFTAPARYDDLLTLKTSISKMGFAKLEHEYELSRDDQILTTAQSVLACLNREGQIVRVSEALNELNEMPSTD